MKTVNRSGIKFRSPELVIFTTNMMRGIAYALIIAGIAIVYFNGIRILQLYHGLLEIEVKGFGWLALGFMTIVGGLIIENAYLKAKLLIPLIGEESKKK